MNLKIGCSGFPVGRTKYYTKFKLVEIQQMFYQLPRIKTVQKWRDHAPKDFEFTLCIKISGEKKKNYGFFKPTDEALKAWLELDKIASILSSEVIVFQCPPTFGPDDENKANMKKFFKAIDRKKYIFVWEVHGEWPEKEIRDICEELDLIHSSDPFSEKVQYGALRYFRLHGPDNKYGSRYTGWDLKKLRDFCENEVKLLKNKPIYVLFNNTYMFDDALRFEWIMKNTGRIKEIDLALLKDLCREMDLAEEDEKVKKLHLEAERIVMLILHTDYARVDIEIEKEKLRQMCKEFFPDKEYLYDMIYARRFDRIWEQFREEK